MLQASASQQLGKPSGALIVSAAPALRHGRRTENCQIKTFAARLGLTKDQGMPALLGRISSRLPTKTTGSEREGT
ncbi:hypothetical protein ACIRFH_03320 [Streptomyces sp. NPDC093586]|uniref:hypothetical protein n=1 Tax=Streptomyces sp. NPDC093586 TaxID=3366042 RepID=UPI0037FE93B5